DTLQVTHEIAVIAGIQQVHSTRKVNDKFINAATGDESFKQSYSHTNPKLGLLYQPQENIQLFANISSSFAPPDYGDLGSPAAASALKAQKAITYEIGTRGNNAYLEWDAAFYYAKLKNELLAVSTVPAVSNPINADRS